jgi:hypothetical protein
MLLAAETLRINKVYRTAINQKTKQLEEVTALNNALEKGTDNTGIINSLRSEPEPNVVNIPENAESMPSLAELDHEILMATRRRGRVWRNVTPAGVDPSGVKVNIPAPVPPGLTRDNQGTVVYLFEDGPAQLPAEDGRPQGKQYLGAFRVTATTGQQATLAPVQPLDQFEQQRLAGSRGPWVIYETMPLDRHAIFAKMSEDDLKKKLPPGSVQEYIRHGKEATADDPDVRKMAFDENGKPLPYEELKTAPKVLYWRQLRNYAAAFDELARRRVEMEVAIAAVKQDLATFAVTLSTAKEMQASKQREVQLLTADLTGIQKERATIDQHLKLVQQQLTRARQLLQETLARNAELARQL